MFQIRLKTLREKTGLSQDALAKKIGVAQSTVGMWESGKNKPENAKLEALANLFKVSTDYLLGRDCVESQGSNENKNSPSMPGEKEITQIYQNLSDENRAKLLELARLYQGAQQNSAENQ